MKKKEQRDVPTEEADMPFHARVRDFPSKAFWKEARADAKKKGVNWPVFVEQALRDRMRKKR